MSFLQITCCSCLHFLYLAFKDIFFSPELNADRVQRELMETLFLKNVVYP